MNELEEMSGFFAKRADTYDEHMLGEVEGCREGYARMARLIPPAAVSLLDLGCGTGLELDEIFRRMPGLAVVGVDMTQAMLDRLQKKHSDRKLTLVKADYFQYDFGRERYDAAVSFETLHHFSHGDKIRLYKRIYDSLKRGGVYIECDYMVLKQEEEDFYYAENARLRREQKIPDGALYHYDTPCTIDNQLAFFKKAGFQQAHMIWRMENTTLLVAQKG